MKHALKALRVRDNRKLRRLVYASNQFAVLVIFQAMDESILDLESHLDRNGTRIVKFFLHLSKDE